MIRATTPIQRFTLPFETEMITDVEVVYGQNGKEKFRKGLDAVGLEGNVLSVKLSEDETFSFKPNAEGQVQLFITTDGYTIATQIIDFVVDPTLKTEV